MILAARSVSSTPRRTVAVAKVKFRKIAVQMLLIAVLINAFHAALENTEITFDGVRVYVIANVFFSLVADALMARKVVAKRKVSAPFISHHRGFFRNVAFDNRNKIGRAHTINME
jgi:hypothetical protein